MLLWTSSLTKIDGTVTFFYDFIILTIGKKEVIANKGGIAKKGTINKITSFSFKNSLTFFLPNMTWDAFFKRRTYINFRIRQIWENIMKS